jgi:2-octaprenyl-6-methoxyphenol hydroxylase
MNDSLAQCDIAIIGGGMVGSSLALALSHLPLDIVMIDPFAPTDEQAPGFDARAIALSRASAKILNSLGLWSDIKEDACPIKTIHVSDKGRPGICRFTAEEVNIPAMGYVVELENVGKAMEAALDNTKVKRLCPAEVTAVEQLEEGSNLSITAGDQQHQVNAQLVIAADGGRSGLRDMLGLTQSEKPYQQAAIISTIQTQQSHGNRAFERFTDDGPVALLPLTANRMSLVWMLTPERAEAMAQAEEKTFIAELQSAFGYRLGKINRVGRRHYYPLTLKQTVGRTQGIIFVGNAAQSLHPIAGQGFNLGLRDVADLVDMIRQSLLDARPLTDPWLVDQYAQYRSADKEHIVTMTDALARLFANASPLLSVPRNALLWTMSIMPEARHEFSRFAMGMNHPASRLTRGLALDLEARP